MASRINSILIMCSCETNFSDEVYKELIICKKIAHMKNLRRSLYYFMNISEVKTSIACNED